VRGVRSERDARLSNHPGRDRASPPFLGVGVVFADARERLRAMIGGDEPAPVAAPTVYTEQLRHPFVRRTASILEAEFPNLVTRPWASDRWRLLMGAGPAVLHLHWIDFLLRRNSASRALLGVTRLLAFVLALRLRGVPTVWTIHNGIGKGHGRRTLDRIVRSLLALLCSRFIVLNRGAVRLAAAELFSPVRGRFLARVRVVPHPMLTVDHGPLRGRREARSALGIVTEVPLIAYLQGAHQPDLADLLIDGQGRYELLTARRTAAPAPMKRLPGCWEFRGEPNDVEYGLLICAADAILLTEPRAFASGTLHIAVELRRPIISPASPSVEELSRLGGAVQIRGPLSVDSVAEAVERLSELRPDRAFAEFENHHSDRRVAKAMARVYRGAGLPI